MTFDVGLFRSQFPEFQDTVTYPDQMIDVWAGLASAQVNSCRWGTQYTLGVSLYVAHELVMARRNVKASAAGGAPGTFGGVAINKTVGSVTAQYDPISTSEKDAGYWNLTNYGKQFIRLARIFGAWCVQLGGGCAAPGTVLL
jgi:hypothetical protein